MEKLFITGVRGQLAHDLLAVLQPEYALGGGDLPEFDLTQPASVTAALEAFRPTVVINAAAFTKVDACETEAATARAVNATGPGLLAAWCAAHDARLLHLSTDYVFDGQRAPPQPYRESDPVGPLSVYGQTKLEGERAVAAGAPRHAILRTAWLYGAHGHNFLKTMLRLTLQRPGQALRVVHDQWGSPTWSRRLALQIRALLQAQGQGLYHATAEGACTWYELAKTFLETLGVPHRLEPCTTADYPTPARRPTNSILENANLKAQGLNVMADWRADVAAFAVEYGERLIAEYSGGTR